MSRVKEEKPGFAERLVAVRKRLGLRQCDAAAEIGISRETLIHIEAGYVASPKTWAKVRRWLEAREAEIAAADRAAAAEQAKAADPPPLPPRVPARLRLAILRKIHGRRLQAGRDAAREIVERLRDDPP